MPHFFRLLKAHKLPKSSRPMDMATGDSPLLSKQANLQAGLPPSKQLQSEEQLPALDEEERKAVHARARSNLAARSSFSPDTRNAPL